MKGMCANANYSVMGFMTEGMGLSGTRLLVYALIYSFSRSGEFHGSRRYLAAATGATLRTVDRAIDSLLESEFILRVGEADGMPIYVADMEVAGKYLQKMEKRCKMRCAKMASVHPAHHPCRICRGEMPILHPIIKK